MIPGYVESYLESFIGIPPGPPAGLSYLAFPNENGTYLERKWDRKNMNNKMDESDIKHKLIVSW